MRASWRSYSSGLFGQLGCDSTNAVGVLDPLTTSAQENFAALEVVVDAIFSDDVRKDLVGRILARSLARL